MEITEDRFYTSHEVGRLLQVSRRSVNNWIEQGRIQAHRTPGGHRRVKAQDLVAFLQAAGFPIPRDLRPLARRRVVIVDDDVRHLRAYQRLLEPHRDVELQLFERGIDALLAIGAIDPHVVVLDIMMPGLDGLEVCRRINASEITRRIDVIMCSGNVSPGLEEEALMAGARCCLRKPVDSGRLIQELGLHSSHASTRHP